MRKNMRKMVSVMTTVALLGTMVGCGSSNAAGNSGSDTAATSGTDVGTVSSGDALAEIEEALADYSGKPAFAAADFEPVDAKSILEGKSIFLLCVNSTNDYMLGMTERYEDLIKACGGDVFVYYADGTNDTWITGMETAISKQYDAIDIVGGATIDTLESVISKAKEAGIYVQDTHSGDVTTTFSDDCSVGADFTKAQELSCLVAIKEVGDPAKVNALVVADVGLDTSDNPSREGVTNIFDQYGVKYTIADVAITDWTTSISEQVRTALISDPSINVILAYYDNMLLYVTPVIEELGLNSDDIVIGSFNGSPGILDMVKEGSVDFDLGESVGWIAAHAFDCLLRGLDGQEPHTEIGTALYMISQDNIDDYLDPATGKATYSYDGVTDIYLEGYSEIWGVDVTGAFDNSDN